jgi:hypothetical protein
MPGSDQYLALDDAALLGQCDVHIYKSSGPGGQHRNKVSSAVRLHHRPTGISAHGDDSRSQHDNKRLALRRLRMNIACSVRGEIDAAAIPQFVRECMFVARGGERAGKVRLEVGAKDFRFWRVAAYLLDSLEAVGGSVARAAAQIGISTGNFMSLLSSDRHLLAAAQQARKRLGLGPLR